MGTYLFGQFLLDEGIVSADQLYAALQYQRQNNKVLGELARDENLLTEQQVAQILEWQLCEDADFGEAAIAMGMLDQAGLDQLLKKQEDNHVLLGEALVAIEAVSQEEMDTEFERYNIGRDEGEGEGEIAEEPSEENTPLAVWSIFSRVLPRFTGGELISGGFYPTIKAADRYNRYIQEVRGDMQFELVVMVPPDVDELLRHSTGGRGSNTATQELLTSVLEVFCSTMEPSGVAVSPRGKAREISEKELGMLKENAKNTSCVEFFLIQPPLLDGEFYEINGCLFFES
jgi:hypothetical protein